MDPAEDPNRTAAVELAFASAGTVYYSNVVNIVTSMHDVRMSFGKLGLTGEVGAYEAHVYMPLPAVKQLQQLLGRVITNYESQFGEIPIEPKATAKP